MQPLLQRGHASVTLAAARFRAPYRIAGVIEHRILHRLGHVRVADFERNRSRRSARACGAPSAAISAPASGRTGDNCAGFLERHGEDAIPPKASRRCNGEVFAFPSESKVKINPWSKTPPAPGGILITPNCKVSWGSGGPVSRPPSDRGLAFHLKSARIMVQISITGGIACFEQ